MKTRLQPAAAAPPDAPIDAAQSADVALREVEECLREAVAEPDSQLAAGVETSALATSSVPSDRPLGRAAFALTLAAGLLLAVWTLWSSFFRYCDYGMVSADVAEITGPWAGKIEAVHVQPGARVQQGDRLATVVDPDLDGSIASMEDRLRTAQAELRAEAARLDASLLTQQDQYLRLNSEYFDLLGRLSAESANAEELRTSRDRLEPLVASSIISEQRIDSLRLRQDASDARVSSLERAIAALEDRLSVKPTPERNEAQLEPWRVKIEQITAEITRLKRKRERGTVRAPFGGQVILVSGHPGEPCSVDRPLVELLDANSVAITIYVSPARVDRYPVGGRVQASVGNARALLTCQVVAIGPQYEASPLELFDEASRRRRLLPVYLSLPHDLPEDLALRAGEDVSIPRSWGG
ncbi:HlyD family efflux transporter periplasmic adaptor subunit [Pirellulales bacterium]|nr:HlyD family efflux transporter periplasmic adaptor subunit [Pirellulales bacterium]